MNDDYAVMRTIAKTLGTTSHKLGKCLRAAGLRDGSGTPTIMAKSEDWTSPYHLDCGLTAYKWHKARVQELWYAGDNSPDR